MRGDGCTMCVRGCVTYYVCCVCSELCVVYGDDDNDDSDADNYDSNADGGNDDGSVNDDADDDADDDDAYWTALERFWTILEPSRVSLGPSWFTTSLDIYSFRGCLKREPHLTDKTSEKKSFDIPCCKGCLKRNGHFRVFWRSPTFDKYMTGLGGVSNSSRIFFRFEPS